MLYQHHSTRQEVARGRVHFCWLLFAVIGFLTSCYVLLVLLPAYRSGIASLSDAQLWQNQLHVPPYVGYAATYDSGMPQLALLLIAVTLLSVPLLAAVLFGMLLVFPRSFTRRAKIGWSSIVGVILVMLYVTWPVAQRLMVWIID